MNFFEIVPHFGWNFLFPFLDRSAGFGIVCIRGKTYTEYKIGLFPRNR